MIEAWKGGEIYSVSLKQLDEKSDNIPVKIYLPSSLSRTVKKENKMNLQKYVINLIRIAKESLINRQFEDAINKF